MVDRAPVLIYDPFIRLVTNIDFLLVITFQTNPRGGGSVCIIMLTDASVNTDAYLLELERCRYKTDQFNSFCLIFVCLTDCWLFIAVAYIFSGSLKTERK